MSGTVQSVARAASMLQVLAVEESLGLAELSAALDLPKPTARGLLKTLIEVGFVDQEPGSSRYFLTSELLQLGASRPDVNELRARALNWTDVLAARTGESAAVAVFRNGEARRIHHVLGGGSGQLVEDSERSTQQIDALTEPLPLHATSLGKVLLAYDPGAARAVASGQYSLLPYTHRTITDKVVLHRQLAQLRERGWAESVEERWPGRAGVAAPVRDRGGYVIASVGIEGPASRMCDAIAHPLPGLVEEVEHAARSVSRELGHGR